MRAIPERAMHIERLGEPYVPFADKLRRLAGSFEERQLLVFVIKYIGEIE
jgi:hypothetical protein